MNLKPLHLTPATPTDIPLLQSIARNTWPKTFVDIISQEQINYMLKWMYNKHTLADQMKNPNFRYFLINQNDGLAAIELHFEGSKLTKLHKLYILPENQGKGWGTETVRQLETISKEAGDEGIILNVNKNNPATHFYEKCGFSQWQSVVIDIGQGYVMDDYVYRKVFR